jgi:hypothetical protein
MRTTALILALALGATTSHGVSALDNDTTKIVFVKANPACQVTKFLSQIDLGEGYLNIPAGTENRVGFFFPSIIVRASVKCAATEDGWEVGFIQGIRMFDFDIAYETGTQSFSTTPTPIADTIRTSVGVFRSVVSRKSVTANVNVMIEHDDQPRYLVPWFHESESGKETTPLKTNGDFAAGVYLVMIHAQSRRMILLRQIGWKSAIDVTCNRLLKSCDFSIKARSAVAVEAVDEAKFPRQILAEPVANNTPSVSKWSPRLNKTAPLDTPSK